jgi:hypothetical protein
VTAIPILFLDIDDVVCLNETYGGYDVVEALRGRHSRPATVFREVFNQRACDVLRQVHGAMNGRLRYVVSSTWREALDLAQVTRVFNEGGLDFVTSAFHEFWRTPVSHYWGVRADDIARWLDRWHAAEPFAIADDTYSGSSLKPALTESLHPYFDRVVLCQENEGLVSEHVRPLVSALKTPWVFSGESMRLALRKFK